MADPVERKIVYNVDEASINKAKKRIQELAQAEADVNAAFLKGDKPLKDYKKELAAVQQEARELGKVLDNLEEPRKLQLQSDRFDSVSRDVALAGDVGSNAATLGSVVGGGAGQALTGAGELAELAEALPRLKAAAAGLPQTIGAAAQALGPGGIAAAAGLAILGVAINKLREEAEKNARNVESAVDVTRRTNQALQTETEDAIQARITSLQSLVDAERQTVADAEAARQAFIDSRTFSGLTEFGDSIGIIGEELQAFDEGIRESESNIQLAELEIRQLNEGLGENATAAADAAAAEEKLATARANAVLQSAQSAADLVRAQQQADDANLDQLNRLIAANENQRDALQAQLDVLIASGDTSEQVAQQIAQLQSQIKGLGDQAAIFEAERPEARARTAAIQAEKDAEKAATDAAREHEQALNNQQRAAESATKAQQSYSDNLRDIAQKTRDSFQDLGIDTAREFADLRRDAQRDDLKAEIDYQRDLAQIRDDARKDQRDVVRTRDFAALAEAREAESEALQERLDEFEFEGDQRLLEVRQQADDILLEERRKGDDLRREAQRQRRDANQDLQDFYRDQNAIQNQAFRSSLNSASQWADGFARIVQNAFSSASGGSSSTGGSASGSNIEDIFRELAMG